MQLTDYKRNVYSQKGEDGIIEKILEVLPRRDRWCVELGAYDGIFYSNTRNLIENHGFSAVLIEADTLKFLELQENYRGFTRVYTENTFIGFGSTDNLDIVLSRFEIPREFDFLSIDIDGNEYHVWERISKYSPKVICIEFNPTIPLEVDFVQEADPDVKQGASLSALVRLGTLKGYELVTALRFNAFFVKAEYFPLFGVEDNSPRALWKDGRVTYLFSDMTGRLHLSGCKKLPWHDVEIIEDRVQQVPKLIRKFPADFKLLEKMFYALFLLKRDRSKFMKYLKRTLRPSPYVFPKASSKI